MASADNAVTRWVAQALQTVTTLNLSTAASGRLYAMTTVAMYDAVNGIDRARHLSTREHALVPPDGAPIIGDRRAAAASAAHAVLIAPASPGSPLAIALDEALANELASFGGLDHASVVDARCRCRRDRRGHVAARRCCAWAKIAAHDIELPGLAPSASQVP